VTTSALLWILKPLRIGAWCPPGFDNTLGSSIDTLSIMSAECERIFSSAERLIIPERNALAYDTIKACEYLKAWCDEGLITGQHDF
jgi:hypothetical protein